ncbi:MAG: phosphoglucosamine mutase [Bacteroidota bacterium]
MSLIKSISGIRGTIGGTEGNGLTPLDIVKYISAFGTLIKKKNLFHKNIIVIGKDARISGDMVTEAVSCSLTAMGFDVIDLGLATTPTVEIAVTEFSASGGVIITASHNPIEWNALKLLNHKGEFISAEEGEELLSIAENGSFTYETVSQLGTISKYNDFVDQHISKILNLKLVNPKAIKSKNLKIAVDGINSVGGIAIPKLLNALGVNNIYKINCTPDGKFAHNPEPLPSHLTEISNMVKTKKADLGIVVDPDVDRLAIINEDGTMFGEEYTLVAVADYILSHEKGAAVSNLSSTQALNDIAKKHGCNYFASAVGEVNVVEKMKQVNAIIGGEGNGGIIYPEFHYGRDALVGIALFLSYLVKLGKKCSELQKSFPQYAMTKNKIPLSTKEDIDAIFENIKKLYSNNKINDEDGVKIFFNNEWAHLRKSNTEPIIRLYTESNTTENAKILAKKIITDIQNLSD